MAVHSTILRGALQLADAAKTGDMRRHRRLPLALRGRFMRADRNEYTCALKNISVGGAAIKSEASKARSREPCRMALPLFSK